MTFILSFSDDLHFGTLKMVLFKWRKIFHATNSDLFVQSIIFIRSIASIYPILNLVNISWKNQPKNLTWKRNCISSKISSKRWFGWRNTHTHTNAQTHTRISRKTPKSKEETIENTETNIKRMKQKANVNIWRHTNYIEPVATTSQPRTTIFIHGS